MEAYSAELSMPSRNAVAASILARLSIGAADVLGTYEDNGELG